MLCPQCGQANPEGAAFCAQCGSRFAAGGTAAGLGSLPLGRLALGAGLGAFALCGLVTLGLAAVLALGHASKPGGPAEPIEQPGAGPARPAGAPIEHPGAGPARPAGAGVLTAAAYELAWQAQFEANYPGGGQIAESGVTVYSRQANGLYLVQSRQAPAQELINARCELVDPQGVSTGNDYLCPLDPRKPALRLMIARNQPPWPLARREEPGGVTFYGDANLTDSWGLGYQDGVLTVGYITASFREGRARLVFRFQVRMR